MWIYASVQFALVVLFAHIFYSVVSTLYFILFSFPCEILSKCGARHILKAKGPAIFWFS